MVHYFEPLHLKKFKIYDVFFNHSKQLVVVCPCESDLKINYIDGGTKERLALRKIACPHKNTTLFVRDGLERKRDITLLINGEEVVILPNNYPDYEGEFVFSTMVKNEDSYIRQWIDYHRKQGATRFIIYDNADGNDNGMSYVSKETTSNLKVLLNDYLESGLVTLIKWSYPKRTSPPIRGSGQTSQQNHSIYLCKNSEYIGIFDIDEYVNVQAQVGIKEFLDAYVSEKQLDKREISSFRLLNRFFYNPESHDATGTNFLNIYNCDQVTRNGREKGIGIPSNIDTYSVHMVTSGKRMYSIPQSRAFFNHYWYLNKNTDRGQKQTPWTDDSIKMHL